MLTIISLAVNPIILVMSIIIIVNIILSILPLSIILLNIIGKFRRSSTTAEMQACQA
jgi:hypothetical protein